MCANTAILSIQGFGIGRNETNKVTARHVTVKQLRNNSWLEFMGFSAYFLCVQLT